MVNINIKLEGVDRALKMLDPKIVQRAAQRTLERAAKSGKTIISSQIREKFNIKKADLDRKIKINPPWQGKLQAELIVKGEPISLIYFGPKQMAGNIQTFISKNKGIAQKQTRRASKFGGVQVRIIRGKEARLRSAFIARGKGGTPFVFRRVGKKRLPLRAMKVVTAQSILKQQGNIRAVKQRILEQLKKEFKHNLTFYQRGK